MHTTVFIVRVFKSYILSWKQKSKFNSAERKAWMNEKYTDFQKDHMLLIFN